MSDKNVEDLKDALHIDREPFSEDGVEGLFYPGGGRQELLDQLTHLSRYGSPLLVMIGENGVGKSTLLSQLASNIDPAVYKAIYIDADILADEQFMLARISDGYALDLGSHSETAVNALVRYSKELDSYSQTPLIIVDNAQNLSSEAVALVQLLLAHAGSSGFRCLMAFDGDSVANIPLLSSLIASGIDYQEISVPLLDKPACSEYLTYRMTTSGLGSIQFNRDQIEQIYNHSQGNPDKANIVARQLLVETFPYKKNQKKPFKLPVIPLVGMLVLVALLVATYWLDDEQGVVPEVAQEPIEKVVDEKSADTAEVEADESVQVEDKAVEVLPEAVVDLDRKEVEKQLDSFASNNGEIDYNYEEPESQELLEPVVKEESSGAASTVSKAESVDLPVDVKSIVQKKEIKPAKVKVAEKIATTTKKLAKPVSAYTQREKWLLSLDKSKYTLQMLGANEKATVHKYLAKYPSLKELAFYRTVRKSQDWYVVVYGQYPSKELAKQALGGLPKSIRDSKPWPRTIASVQDDIQLSKK